MKLITGGCRGLFWLGFTTCSVVAQTITPTATFHNIGITVELPTATPHTVAKMWIKPSGSPLSDFKEVHPLAKVTPTRFSGSAFHLQAGTSYDLKLISPAFSDQIFTVKTRVDSFPQATLQTLYVSPRGNDSNNGSSLVVAFKTLGKALSTATPGTKILLHDGTYYEGDLETTRSGTASAPIVIENAPGAHPILSGLDTHFTPTPSAWVVHDAAAHCYKTPTSSIAKNGYLNGVQLYHFAHLEDLINPVGERGWQQLVGYHLDGNFLYARFPENADPRFNTNYAVTLPQWTTGLAINHSHIHVRGVEFAYYGFYDFHRGIYINDLDGGAGGDFNLIENCTFHHNGVGVAFKGAADYNTIQYCNFTESPVSTWWWYAVKEGGTDYESGGCLVYGSSYPNRANVIRHCKFSDMFDGCHLYGDNRVGPTENMDFHNNVISDCSDDGVETDGAGVNCRIYFNRIEKFLTGISVAPAGIGPTYVFRNILLQWRNSVDFEGYPFKFNVNSSLSTQWVYLYHNTCYTDVAKQPAFLFKQYSNWNHIITRNNIFSGTASLIQSSDNISVNVDMDYDCLYTTQTAQPLIQWGNTNYNSLTSFSAAQAEEANGIFAQPALIDAPINMYLSSSSPLVDRGLKIPGINDRYLGAAPDIGALESGMTCMEITRSSAGVIIDWQVGAFVNYQLQQSSDLLPASWQDVGLPAQALETLLRTSVPHSIGQRCFYRLKQVSP